MMKALQDLIKLFEKRTGVEFTGEFNINPRLTKTLGRCKAIFTKNIRTGEITKVEPTEIEISKKFLDRATTDEIVDVVAHEFAHYCAYREVGNHNHNSEVFKKYCDLLGTSSAPSMTLQNKIQSKYDIYCSKCGGHVASRSSSRARVVQDATGYKSGCCKAPVKVIKNY